MRLLITLCDPLSARLVRCDPSPAKGVRSSFSVRKREREERCGRSEMRPRHSAVTGGSDGASTAPALTKSMQAGSADKGEMWVSDARRRLLWMACRDGKFHAWRGMLCRSVLCLTPCGYRASPCAWWLLLAAWAGGARCHTWKSDGCAWCCGCDACCAAWSGMGCVTTGLALGGCGSGSQVTAATPPGGSIICVAEGPASGSGPPKDTHWRDS